MEMFDNQSLMAMNLSELIDAGVPPLTKIESCHLLRIIGCYYIVLSITGTFLNGSLLYTLIRYPKLRRLSTNILIGGLLFADLIGASCEVPLPAFSLLNCRWLFTRIGCTYEGFISYFVGCSNIYVLCLISIDRYSIVTKSSRQSTPMIQRAYLSVVLAYVLSLFWTVMPLLGWSYYDFEGIRVSCSIKWADRSLNVVSYNVAMLIFVYFAPVIIILITHVKIYRLIQTRQQSTTTALHRSLVHRRQQTELRMLRTIIFVIGGFLTAWTPYAILILMQVIFNVTYIPPIMITMPALLAKTSFVWNPFILIMRNGHFRHHLPWVTYDHHRSNSNKETRVIQIYIYQD